MLATFIGLFIWVLLPSNKKGFDNAANLPFEEDTTPTERQAVDNDRRETP